MLPFVSLFGLRVPMYGLCMALGILAGGGLMLARGKRMGCDVNDLIVVMACAAGGALLGAKGLYIVSSYGLRAAWESLRRGDLRFLTEGGLVFYGGLLGGMAGALAGVYFTKQAPETVCALAAPSVPLGHAFGRLGCYFAGCCYGVAYDGPLAAITPYAPGGRFPVQLLEAALNLALAAALLRLSRRRPRRLSLLYIYLALYAVERFLLEYLRGDEIRGSLGALSTSQIISAALLAASLALLWRERPGRAAR